MCAIDHKEASHDVHRFSTATRDLLERADWLAALGVKHVAMEATGIYWKPIWHILEGRFELVLANAAHIRNVPGRKSDVNDAMWISDLLAHGLIRASFVPQPRFRIAVTISYSGNPVVFRSAKRNHMPDIRDPKRRIDLVQARNGLLRLIEPPDEAGCSHARCASLICWLRQARGVGQLLMLFPISPLNGGCASAEKMKRKLRYPLSASTQRSTP
jgi:Transposase